MWPISVARFGVLSRASSTPVTVTVLPVDQLDVVKLNVAGSTVAAEASAVATATDTAAAGCVANLTV